MRFREQKDAIALVDLSRSLEQQLDKEYVAAKKSGKKPKKDENSVIGKMSLLKGELELNGRRLVVMPQVARTKVNDVVTANKDKEKNRGEDRRNLYLKKEGLLSEKDWVHQQPALTSKDLEAR